MRLLALTTFIAAVFAIAVGGLWAYSQYVNVTQHPLVLPEGEDAEPVILNVEPGTSFSALAHELHERGIISQPRVLAWYAQHKGLASRIKAGEYELQAGLTAASLLDKLVRGDVILHSLTLVEGWNFRQVVAAVRASEHLRQTLGESTPETIMTRVGAPGVHPEGRFLPDTYKFGRGTTDVEFLTRAYQAMRKLLESEWPKRDPAAPLKTPDEALTLASIVEKETGRADERERVAGVFARRLVKGMKLQTDPTVVYALGESYDGNIRKRDLSFDSPYNTYVYPGLPPTPIAMPGAASIRAALHPASGNALYFVARGDGAGGHEFSATYAEHQRAVRRYLRRLRAGNKE
ncbi:MAG: endolytic transglycosylase MltG [Gammaproteobacteria bacterium]